MSDLRQVQSLDAQREAVREEMVKELEALITDVRAGTYTGLLVFHFGQLPPIVGHEVIGQVLEAQAVFAVERWKVQLMQERE